LLPDYMKSSGTSWYFEVLFFPVPLFLWHLCVGLT
jgi:hypothetical protein